MHTQALFSIEGLSAAFVAIEPELIRFPALDFDVLRRRVEGFIEQAQSKEEGK